MSLCKLFQGKAMSLCKLFQGKAMSLCKLFKGKAMSLCKLFQGKAMSLCIEILAIPLILPQTYFSAKNAKSGLVDFDS